MKKFKFRLQKLLDARAAKEKLIKNELAKVVGEQNLLRERQNRYIKEVERQKEEFHEKFRTGGVEIDEFQSFQRFSNFTDKLVAGTEKEIEAMQPKIEEIRTRLAEATREKRVVEKLKEKRQAEWNYEYNKMIEKENDDMNQKIYVRTLEA